MQKTNKTKLQCATLGTCQYGFYVLCAPSNAPRHLRPSHLRPVNSAPTSAPRHLRPSQLRPASTPPEPTAPHITYEVGSTISVIKCFNILNYNYKFFWYYIECWYVGWKNQILEFNISCQNVILININWVICVFKCESEFSAYSTIDTLMGK
jgi:hypothetical protein